MNGRVIFPTILRGQGILAGRLALGLGVAAAGTLLMPPASEAGLRICNGTLDLVNVAIGYQTETGIRTEGWWTVTANACAQVVQEPLRQSIYYLHVEDGFGESRLEGDVTLCVQDRKFSLVDADQCWQRGLIEAGFFQVETGGAVEWTVLLSYD